MKLRLAVITMLYVLAVCTVTFRADTNHVFGLSALATCLWGVYLLIEGLTHRPWMTGALLLAIGLEMALALGLYYALGFENLVLLIVMFIAVSWFMWDRVYSRMLLAAPEYDANFHVRQARKAQRLVQLNRSH